MIYDIVNPSDDVTFFADDLEVAYMVCLLLGEGRYGLNDEDGNEVMPLLLFGTFEEWQKKNHFSFDTIYANKLDKVITALRTMMCCRVRERQAVIAAVGDDLEALARYNDEKRSSLNNICDYAFVVANRLEKTHVATATANSGAGKSTQEVEA